MKHIFLFLLCLFTLPYLHGQTIDRDTLKAGIKNTENLLTQVRSLPPSPTSAALAKFIDVPVSYYTGTAQINIPLLSLAEKELKVDLSLNYHASGIKAEDIPGWVGSNWALNGGPFITRTLQGRPDEAWEGFLSRYQEVQTIQSYSSVSSYHRDT
jgi:hypothetical protein